jgi:hypothetical protein
MPLPGELGREEAPTDLPPGSLFSYIRRAFMEHPGITIYRQLLAIATGHQEIFGPHADPYLSEVIEFMCGKVPRFLTTEQQLRAAIDLHRLMDPGMVSRGRRFRRLHHGDVQIVLTQEQYRLLRKSSFSKLFEELELGVVEPTALGIH